MRIVLLTQYYPPEVGAAPVRLQAMVRQLVRRGHEVEVVTALPNYPAGRIFPQYRKKLFVTERRDDAIVRRVWIYAATGSGVGRMLQFMTFAVMSVIAMFRTRRPDVVLVESPPLLATIPGILHRWIRRTPNVLLLADLWPDTAVELGLLNETGLMHKALAKIERVAYRSSWKVSPVTEGQVETLVNEKDVARSKIAFLPNGVDTDLFVPAKQPVAHESKVVLFAGTLGYAQGLDVVLDAALIVVAERPEARFVFVGGGSDKERLVARVRDEQIPGVEFRDPVSVDEIAPMYRNAFAGITSLKSSKVLEGARPSKIFPVMASGRPVVYSGDGEGAGLVTGWNAGVVAPAEDAEALAIVIIRLLDNPADADEMGRSGRSKVVENLSWDVLIDRWLEELDDDS